MCSGNMPKDGILTRFAECTRRTLKAELTEGQEMLQSADKYLSISYFGKSYRIKSTQAQLRKK